MTQEKQPSIDWRRIYALPYDHFFKDKVKEARLSLGLPPEGITDNSQARDWLHNHLGLQKPFLPHVTTIPLWIALLPSVEKNLQKTVVPLLKWAVILVSDFKLPIRMRNYIGLYILTNDDRLLTSWKGLNIIPALNNKTGKLQLTVTVNGIDEWTTKEEWLQVWDDWVQMWFEQTPRGKRPGRGDEVKERIKRYAEWYKLSEQPNSGPAKALSKWEKHHQDDRGKHDYSTVVKAIAEFKRLIKPASS